MSSRDGEDRLGRDGVGVAAPVALPDVHGSALIAYRLFPHAPMRLGPAQSGRAWMAATPDRFANRCLPLLIANQAGWTILNSHAIRATWTGGDDPRSLQVDYLRGFAPYPASSHFGHGILTWTIPYLFRTPPGYNLLARGPANWPKDGASPLEGIVETDWSVATFTMNWKLTRANLPVTFDVDEPICMLVPQRRGELEAFSPELRDVESEPAIARASQHWFRSRQQFLAELGVPDSEAATTFWQKHYFQGTSPDGYRAPEHQLKLRLRGFRETDEENGGRRDVTESTR